MQKYWNCPLDGHTYPYKDRSSQPEKRMTTNKLTQEEKRIKIAEACSKEPVCVCPIHGSISGRATPEKMLVTNCPWCGNDLHWEDFPDYFGDLNAIHEAENVLNEDQWDVYADHLDDMTMYSHGHASRMAHATAKQRAEAFGLTLGLWEAGQ